MSDNNDRRYGFANLFSDILAIVGIIFILDCCGCGISKKIGSIVGEGYKSFKDRTTEINPSDLR